MFRTAVIWFLFCISASNADYGEPLHLTPLINAGRILEAQNLSRVNLEKFNEIHSYSGYITVNEQFNSNIFFWFFESINCNVNDAPLILWLQGGPGSSGLIGVFSEIGPITFDINGNLERRTISWNDEYSLLFVDSPVGTGFSYTNGGYAENITKVGEDLHEALLQFFALFPNLAKNDFFIFGESYAGKYAPALVNTILNDTEKINLKGIAVGNPLSDPINQLEYGRYLYEHGLVDDSQRTSLEMQQKKVKRWIREESWTNAANSFYILFGTVINMTQIHCQYNYLYDQPYIDTKWFQYVQDPEFRKMIHVGNMTLHNQRAVRQALVLDQCQSVVPLIVKILKHYPVMFYGGQLDIILPYPFMVNFIRRMKFSGSEEYKKAQRVPWYCFDGAKNTLCGYKKKAGNLTDVLVRDAGHIVPYDQPSIALDMVRGFIDDILNK